MEWHGLMVARSGGGARSGDGNSGRPAGVLQPGASK